MDRGFTIPDAKAFDLPSDWVEQVNNTCFALRNDKGCMALMYTLEDIKDKHVCEQCKFKKTLQEWLAEKNKKRQPHLKGFYLVMDNDVKGFFKSIKDIDRWLTYYWETCGEAIPENTEQNDFNVLFITHDIKIVY